MSTFVLIPGAGSDPRVYEKTIAALEFQRRVARNRLGLEIDEMAGGHVPMLSRLDELAERLVALAGGES